MRFMTMATLAALLAAPVLWAQEERPAQDDPGVLKAGVCAEYYNFGKEIKKFPADMLAGQTPQVCRVDTQINFESKDGFGFRDLPWKEHFVAVWTGVLRVPADGKVTFYLKSDDGSKLFLDGKVLIDNDGTHRMDEDGKAVDLTAGDHEFRIEYFQNKDKAGCVLSWKREGGEKEAVPASAFYHKFNKTIDSATK